MLWAHFYLYYGGRLLQSSGLCHGLDSYSLGCSSESWVWLQATWFQIYGGQSGIVTGFSWNTSTFPCHYNSFYTPHSFILLCQYLSNWQHCSITHLHTKRMLASMYQTMWYLNSYHHSPNLQYDENINILYSDFFSQDAFWVGPHKLIKTTTLRGTLLQNIEITDERYLMKQILTCDTHCLSLIWINKLISVSVQLSF